MRLFARFEMDVQLDQLAVLAEEVGLSPVDVF